MYIGCINQTQHNMLKKLLLVACVTLTAFTTVSAQQANQKLPKGMEFVTSVEGITEYRLSNGLRVLLFPDPSKPTITVNITYLVGSKHENYGETGMAHLLEHLVFKGTPKHPDIPKELTERGARPNGTTWLDRTNYYETFAATEDNLRWALDLEADRMVNSYIAKKDLDSEMTVVRNEFEMGENNPTSILMQRVSSTAYLWHNYGKSTIGCRADLENVPIDRLQAFYKRYYQPDNAVLLVAGKIDPAKTIELVNQYFAPIPKPERVLHETYTAEPTQDGERFVSLRRVGDVQIAMAAYHIPPASHPDFAGVEIISDILTNSPSGRLYKAMVEPKVGSYIYGFAFPLKEPGIAFYWADVRKEQPMEDARKLLLSTLDNLKTEPITKDEVERARTKLLKGVEQAFNSSERLGLGMSEYIAAGDWRLFFLRRDRIKTITTEEVQRIANAYYKPANRTVGFFIPTESPDRAEVPGAPDVQALVKNYKGEAAIAMGEAFDASPSNIETRTKKGSEANSYAYAFLPKQTRGGTVVARMNIRYGTLESLQDKALVARFTASMLNKGTKKRSREQIKDEFDRLKANVGFYGSAASTTVSIETIKDNLPEVMKLVAEVLKEPAFSESEFEKLKQLELARIEESMSDPQYLAFIALQRHLNPYPKKDPRYVRTPDEEIADIKALTLDQVKKFYKDFYGATYAQLSVVGDFDEPATKKLSADLFAKWKSASPYVRYATEYKNTASVNNSIKTPDKANAMFVAGMNLNMRDDDPNYAAMVLGNYMLGGGFLNSRLATRIRQKEGLSYGVGSGVSISSLDKAGTFTAYAIYAPENAEKLEAAFKEEIQKMLKEGFTQEELDAAKSGYLQSRQVSRAQDASLANMLSNNLFLKRDMKWEDDLDKKLQQVTAAQVLTAMRQHIDPDKITIIKAGDFKTAEKIDTNKK
jgi:zinc protease